MKRILSGNRVIALFPEDGEEFLVMATAEASYAEPCSLLLMELDSHVRPVIAEKPNAECKPDWLPGKQVIRKHVPPGEARDVARQIFRRWSGRIRRIADEHMPVPVAVSSSAPSRMVLHA